ncbi:MAG: CinA family protein [Clostridia bacterium]|nr:CinA family protein [Clostridia bacterium]
MTDSAHNQVTPIGTLSDFSTQLTAPEGPVNETAVRQKYERITRKLISLGITITTMESCTSGQIASLITDTEGASAILKGAFVTYSNESKIQMGVPEEVIRAFGVYSGETAASMAEACRSAMHADIGIGITGSFGNTDPNNPDSVPGEVFFAIALDRKTERFHSSVPPQTSRLAYKLYMADVVADRILSCLI